MSFIVRSALWQRPATPPPPPLIYPQYWRQGGPQEAGGHDMRHGDVSSTPPRLVSTLGFFSTRVQSQPETSSMGPAGERERETETEEKRNSTSVLCICISFACITMCHLTQMEGSERSHSGVRNLHPVNEALFFFHPFLSCLGWWYNGTSEGAACDRTQSVGRRVCVCPHAALLFTSCS